MTGHLLAYAGLFLSSLAAATVLPVQSEIALVGLLAAGRHAWWMLVLVASLGNIFGSVINWGLGRLLTRLEGRRPVSNQAQDARPRGMLVQTLRPLVAAAVSWLPVVGDPLTIVAGALREPLPVFLALVTAAKVARYLAVAALTLGWM